MGRFFLLRETNNSNINSLKIIDHFTSPHHREGQIHIYTFERLKQNPPLEKKTRREAQIYDFWKQGRFTP